MRCSTFSTCCSESAGSRKPRPRSQAFLQVRFLRKSVVLQRLRKSIMSRERCRSSHLLGRLLSEGVARSVAIRSGKSPPCRPWERAQVVGPSPGYERNDRRFLSSVVPSDASGTISRAGRIVYTRIINSTRLLNEASTAHETNPPATQLRAPTPFSFRGGCCRSGLTAWPAEIAGAGVTLCW